MILTRHLDFRTSSCLPVLAALVSFVASSASSPRAFGADDGAFKAVGTLGKAVKGTDFHEFTYYVVDGRKRTSVKALVKIPDAVELVQDRPGRLSELKEGDAARIYGLPEEREVIGTGGLPAGVDRFIRRASVVVTGGTKVNTDYKSKDPKDKGLKWCECQVEKGGKSTITVDYERGSYRVSLDRRFQMIVRAEIPESILEKARKKLIKKGAYMVVSGKSAELPEEYKPSKRDGDVKAYEISRVVAVTRATAGLYGTLLSLD